VTSEQTISLRPATPDDYDFSWSLYVTTIRGMTEELLGWHQDRQSASFAAGWRVEEVRIILADSSAVGWLQTALVDDAVFLKQLYIDPSFHRMGFGTRVIRSIIGEARRNRMPVALAVMKNNPARYLYFRLGFRTQYADQYKFYMQRDP
jgi:ribosomal protein S18 acetylase RimI-like enzyme